MFLYEDINGDINYKSTTYENKVIYDYDGFKYYVIKKHQTLTEKYQEQVEDADYYFENKDYETAIEYYKKALEFKQKDYAQNQINECHKKIKEIQEEKERKFKNCIKQANDNFNNYRFKESKQWYENSFSK